jgi:protein-tyrosine phosphatase
VGGKAVATALASGRRVLVTCAAGLNRSALVASLGLGMVTRMSAGEIITLMRTKRSPLALHNKHFVDLIQRFAGARSRPVVG